MVGYRGVRAWAFVAHAAQQTRCEGALFLLFCVAMGSPLRPFVPQIWGCSLSLDLSTSVTRLPARTLPLFPDFHPFYGVPPPAAWRAAACSAIVPGPTTGHSRRIAELVARPV